MLMHRPQTAQPCFGSITLLQKFSFPPPPFQNPGSVPADPVGSLRSTAVIMIAFLERLPLPSVTIGNSAKREGISVRIYSHDFAAFAAFLVVNLGYCPS